MQTDINYSRLAEILRCVLDRSRHAINRHLLARRIASGTAIGLILCFPMLPLMLWYRASGNDMAMGMGLLIITAILALLLRGPWANSMDAAVGLDNQYRHPGLFITVMDLLSQSHPAICAPQDEQQLALLSLASGVYRDGTSHTAGLIQLAPVFPRLWAVNGLLLMGLLITAVVGKSMLASSSQAGNATTFTSKPPLVAMYPNANPRTEPAKSNTVPALRRGSSITAAAREPSAAMMAQIAAQRRVNRSIRRIHAAIGRLLAKSLLKKRSASQGDATENSGSGPKSPDSSLEALKSQLLVTARSLGVGAKTRTMLIAAADAIGASSRGRFTPQLRRINRQLEKYLALHNGVAIASGFQFPAHAGGNASGKYHAVEKSGPENRGNSLRRTGNSGRAVIMDIPPPRHSRASVPLRWGPGRPIHALAIPVRYRNFIRRYFSNSIAGSPRPIPMELRWHPQSSPAACRWVEPPVIVQENNKGRPLWQPLSKEASYTVTANHGSSLTLVTCLI